MDQNIRWMVVDNRYLVERWFQDGETRSAGSSGPEASESE